MHVKRRSPCSALTGLIASLSLLVAGASVSAGSGPRRRRNRSRCRRPPSRGTADHYAVRDDSTTRHDAIGNDAAGDDRAGGAGGDAAAGDECAVGVVGTSGHHELKRTMVTSERDGDIGADGPPPVAGNPGLTRRAGSRNARHRSLRLRVGRRARQLRRRAHRRARRHRRLRRRRRLLDRRGPAHRLHPGRRVELAAPFDAYVSSLGTGSAANWDAGLATANTGRPTSPALITGGDPNVSGDPTADGGHQPAATADQPLFFAVEQANQFKSVGSRLFAIGVGNTDSATLAADQRTGCRQRITASEGPTPSPPAWAPPPATAAHRCRGGRRTSASSPAPTTSPTPVAIAITRHRITEPDRGRRTRTRRRSR